MHTVGCEYLYFVFFQGKFIRIHFGTNGKIAGADIETCMSENSKFCFTIFFENEFCFILDEVPYALLRCEVCYTSAILFVLYFISRVWRDFYYT